MFSINQQLSSTLIWTTIAGAIDEAYQYFYLAPKDTFYYDMNDVVTNLLGAVFGLLFLWSFKIPNMNQVPFWKSTGFYGIAIIPIFILLLTLLGILSIHPSDETPYQLLRKWPEGFWTNANHGVIYHIIQPIEGTLITVGLWGLYYKIGRRRT